jgi:hypothetical protein
MNILAVTDRKTRKQFLDVPRILYRNDKVWVCPLDNEVEGKFDPEQNSYFKHGEVKRWIIVDDSGQLCGRIAAFYSSRVIAENEQPTGGVGFFECIHDQHVANLLFDTAREWLSLKGMEAMDGSVNPGENDSHWGILVEGFTHPGFGMPYNFPYYSELFENYGFRLYFEQFSYHLNIKQPFPERFWKIADWAMRKPGFSYRHFRFSEAEKFIADMVHVYNEAWSRFKEDFIPMDPNEVRETFRKAKAIIDEELIWYAYHNEIPVAFFIMFPDINQVIKPFRGKLNLLNMLRFLYAQKTHKITRIRALVAGVVPKYQNSGIESAIFKHLEKVMERKPYYQEVELSWVGDFNPKMRSLYEAVGAKMAKKHITYRYLFDPTRPFKRFMAEAVEKQKRFGLSSDHGE